jgi:uncharacterized protein YukJ
MPLTQYGVLKGTAVGRKRDAGDDHYQVLIEDGKTMNRIAVNVKSSAPKAPSTLLFQTATTLPDKLKSALTALRPGYWKPPPKPDGLAQDFVRGGIVKPSSMIQVPPDQPGVDNDLKDKLEDAVRDAMDKEGSVIYAFGERRGPEKNNKDQYFQFTPGNGMHDIHMNQGKWREVPDG